MSDKRVALERSTDMVPVEGSVEVAIPVHLLWQFFLQARWWPRWNRCFFWVFNRSLQAGKRLIWCFEPIRRWYLYKLPAIATVVEVEPERKVTWEVTILPGFYARHTYFMEDLGDGRTRFGSWEKAQGWSFRLCKWFWIPHFVFVRDQSLQGARRLEEVYRREGKLTEEVLEPRRYRWFFLTLLLVVLFLAAGGFAGWFYFSFVRLTVTELAPGVYALFGGGGNSLVVHDNGEVLLVDPKFPPVSRWVEGWIARHLQVPVTLIVNTHYHFDHTRGNIHYPGVQIVAQRMVPELMQRRDGRWWKKHPEGIPPPSGLVDTTRALHVGEQEIIVTHPGPAHTAGDLWVYLQRDGVTIVATGDLVFHGYYPFFDLGEGGVSLPNLIRSIRHLARTYPEAIFVPGHGPLATARDLERFADYLQFLSEAVARARQAGLTERETVARIDLSPWHLSLLPIFAYGQLWSTASTNIRAVYRYQEQRHSPVPSGQEH